MKYYTKEWYALSQRCHYHENLAVTQSAKRRSEGYFQALYARKLAEHLRLQREMAALTVDDVFPLDENLDALAIPQENGTFLPAKEALSPEAFAGVQAEIRQQIEEARANWAPEVYDEAQSTADFETRWRQQMAYFQKELPEDVLSQVADLRVLALGCCSRKVKQALAALSRENERRAAAMVAPYDRWLEEEAVGRLPEDWVLNFGFHDATVTGLRQEDGDLTMGLEGDFAGVSAVTWHNAQVLEMEDGFLGATWLYEELHPVGKRCQFHALLMSQANQLIYFTVEADDFSTLSPKAGEANEDEMDEIEEE